MSEKVEKFIPSPGMVFCKYREKEKSNLILDEATRISQGNSNKVFLEIVRMPEGDTTYKPNDKVIINKLMINDGPLPFLVIDSIDNDIYGILQIHLIAGVIR